MPETAVVSPVNMSKTYSCKFPLCKSAFYAHVSAGFKQKKFFVFPRDISRATAWKEACCISPSANTINYRVCSDHFSPSDYYNPRVPTRLHHEAVPGCLPIVPVHNDHCYAQKPDLKINSTSSSDEVIPSVNSLNVNLGSNNCHIVQAASCEDAEEDDDKSVKVLESQKVGNSEAVVALNTALKWAEDNEFNNYEVMFLRRLRVRAFEMKIESYKLKSRTDFFKKNS